MEKREKKQYEAPELQKREQIQEVTGIPTPTTSFFDQTTG